MPRKARIFSREFKVSVIRRMLAGENVSAIARELHIPTVIVPLFPSHFSALGMLLADERHDFIRTFYGDLTGIDFAALVQTHEEQPDILHLVL